ncbi:MAG: tRNA (adenosine(37)-N6)-dimethylallyltransferase MiaA, partial [Polyangiaceae bacterium]|nr:tRNA (adenosine(37)-N6)-dimethylallyltransferase MiaA [Polyangiaceae bacterium]
DIGSGKPTPDELARAPHHVVGVVEPLDSMDAGIYVKLADAAIADVRARGNVPIVCGGTFLWVKALTRGLAEAAPRDEAIRLRHREEAEAQGRAAFHAKLAEVDPEMGKRLAPNDFVRVSRALEVFELTGRPLTAWQAEHGFATERYPVRLLAPAIERSALDEKLERRARAWLDHGWIEEVEALVASGFSGARAMGSVGYKEVLAFTRGELGRDDLLGTIVRATRVFVRRQRTWIRDEPVAFIDA